MLPQLDAQKPGSVLLSLIRFVEDALRELHQQSPSVCEQSLSAAFVKLVEMLGAETEDVRFAAGSAVTSVFQFCVSEGLVRRCSSDSAPQGRENVLKRCMVSLGGLLGVGFRDSWPHVLRCLGAIFTVLGPVGAPLAVPLMEVITSMARCASAPVSPPSHSLTCLRVAQLLNMIVHNAVSTVVGAPILHLLVYRKQQDCSINELLRPWFVLVM